MNGKMYKWYIYLYIFIYRKNKNDDRSENKIENANFSITELE